jgi:hypothetical protein
LIDSEIFAKRILEPSCGQGIFLKLLSDIYLKFPDDLLISNFISNSIFFVDVQEEMVEKTKSNIQKLYTFLFDKDFQGSFNGITWILRTKFLLDYHCLMKSKLLRLLIYIKHLIM